MNALPNELLEHILSQLRAPDVPSSAMTCKRFDALFQSPIIWKKVAILYGRCAKLNSKLLETNYPVLKKIMEEAGQQEWKDCFQRAYQVTREMERIFCIS
jgi:hypothetical protein